MAQSLYDCYPQGRVCVKGNASEIARVRFRLPEGEEVTAERLAAFSSLVQQYSRELGENPYVIQAWKKWLLRLGDIYNIHVLDLFYWEHWAGNFAAMSQAEWDIVQEVFTPYNCRSLLTNMLAVNEELRDHDETVFYRELINGLWPEVLSEPINPPYKPPIRYRIRQQIRRSVPFRFRRWGLNIRDSIRDRMVPA
jgi:hypothetical protein